MVMRSDRSARASITQGVVGVLLGNIGENLDFFDFLDRYPANTGVLIGSCDGCEDDGIIG